MSRENQYYSSLVDKYSFVATVHIEQQMKIMQ